MQALMSAFGPPNLGVLAELLRDPSLPTQKEIARETQTDQGFISHARRGELVRVTPRVERLWRYANMRLKGQDAPPFVAAAVQRYLARGGDPTLLIRQLRLLEEAQLGFGKT